MNKPGLSASAIYTFHFQFSLKSKSSKTNQGENRDIDGEHCDCWAGSAKERGKVPPLEQDRLSEQRWSFHTFAVVGGGLNRSPFLLGEEVVPSTSISNIIITIWNWKGATKVQIAAMCFVQDHHTHHRHLQGHHHHQDHHDHKSVETERVQQRAQWAHICGGRHVQDHHTHHQSHHHCQDHHDHDEDLKLERDSKEADEHISSGEVGDEQVGWLALQTPELSNLYLR